jgi:hypothetical protein
VVVERHSAEALELRDLSARLDIESGFGTEVEVRLEGPAAALRSLQRVLAGDTLVIAGQRSGGPATSTHAAALTARIRVPAGMPIAILGHQGEIASGDLEGPLVLELLAGVATLGQVRDARLTLLGAGKIAAREALGDLSIAVAGAGEVLVDTSILERLEVGVTGSGAVEVGGAVRYASLSLKGSGHIYVAQAKRHPLVERIGPGEVLIGAR